jgi:hypothetical protein
VKTENDGGWSMKDYKVKFEEELKEKVDEKKEKKKEETGDVPITMDLVEFERLTKTMFPKWSKSESKIASFMKNLDPVKEYTKKEIMKIVNESGVNRLMLIMNRNINNTNAYGQIIKNNNDKYMLQSELVSCFNKYF